MVRNRKKTFFCFFLHLTSLKLFYLFLLEINDCPCFTQEYGDTIAISGCVLKSGEGLLMMLFGLFPNDFKTRYFHVIYLALDLPFGCTTSWKRWKKKHLSLLFVACGVLFEGLYSGSYLMVSPPSLLGAWKWLFHYV